MHATEVEDPRAVKAALNVLYSPERVPLPLTVRHPVGGLVLPALFCTKAAASMEMMREKIVTTALWRCFKATILSEV